MSNHSRPQRPARARPDEQAGAASIFAALGDETRLALVARLSTGARSSISRLTEGSRVTRQAVTKHLRVLQHAGVVRSVRHGRERLFELDPRAIDHARAALEGISRQWDEALGRLKAFVEERSH